MWIKRRQVGKSAKGHSRFAKLALVLVRFAYVAYFIVKNGSPAVNENGCFLGQAIFAKQKTKKGKQETIITLSNPVRR